MDERCRGRRTVRVMVLVALIACVVLGLAACSSDDSAASYTTFAELEDKRIGVITGTVQAGQAQKRFSHATFLHFTTATDALGALKSHKIDAFAESDATVRTMQRTEPELVCLEERLSDAMRAGAIFAKTSEGRALCDEYSAYVREIKASGEYDEITAVWLYGDDEDRIPPDYGDLTGERGTLRMAVDTSMYPLVYVKNGRLAGLDPIIAYRFAKSHGYDLDPLVMDFGGILPAIVTGKCDFAAGGVAYTDERAESVNFSEPTYEGYSVIAVLGEQTGGGGIVDAIVTGFEKTFVREGRWKLFVVGIGNTLLITILACILGTVLGFICYLARRTGVKAVVWVTDAAIKLIHGMPTVVLLMVLYYIVFGAIDLSGLVVAIIGFALVFAVAMYGMLDSGVRSVDAGQSEAASALGYTDRAAFFKLILPQAALHFMPDYAGNVTSLLKATSVVGYIAVQDLTKMGDIIRSATYEAFFPLIAVTILYFAIEFVLSKVITSLAGRFDTRHRTREQILKGITT